MEPVGWRWIKAAPTLGPEPEPGPPVFVAFEQKDVASWGEDPARVKVRFGGGRSHSPTIGHYYYHYYISFGACNLSAVARLNTTSKAPPAASPVSPASHLTSWRFPPLCLLVLVHILYLLCASSSSTSRK